MLVQSPSPVPSSFAALESQAVMLRKRNALRSEQSSSDYCSLDNSSSSSLPAARAEEEASTSQHHNVSIPRERASLPKPSEQVMQVLQSREAGQQLLMQIRGSRATDPRDSTTESERRLECSLREIHASLLEVDEDLMDPSLKAADQEAVSSCRDWLQKLQSFMLSLQRSLTADFPSRTSSGRLAQGAQQAEACNDPEWQAFLGSISTEFGHVLEAMDEFSQQSLPQQFDVVDTKQKDQDLCRRPSRLVCQRSRLAYSQFWAGKVGV